MCPSFSESGLLGEGAPSAFCMNVKTKELLNLHFVSVRKQREGLAVDNRWDLLPLRVEVRILRGLWARAVCKKVTGAHPEDSERVRRTAWRASIVGGARKNHADSITLL